jgi:hypothetical protein
LGWNSVIVRARRAASGARTYFNNAALLNDGKILIEGAQNTAEIEQQTDWSRIKDFAYMRLNPNAEPGDYSLQIVVRDLLGGKDAVTSQSIDFVVEK